MSISEMDVRAASYFDLLAQIEALQAEAEAIKDSFKAAMVVIEQEEITGHGWRATWHNTNTSRFDSKRFKADHPELASAYTISSTGTRFTLNPIRA